MSLHHVVDNVLVVGTSLIVGRPAAIDKLKSFLLDKLLDFVACLLGLPVVPHSEELDLDISKLGIWPLVHLLYHSVQDEVHGGMMGSLIGTAEVFVHGF